MQATASLLEEVEAEQPEVVATEAVKEYRFNQNEKASDFTVEQIGEHEFEIHGEVLERLVQRINLDHQDGVMLLARKLKNLGVDEALRANGAEDGDDVYIGDFTFEFVQ